ncbi:MAG: hypothetical protein HY814_00175, partial [Candidatus Riflebacteria bacterium]|nr:hypothetical protein [Candidatus Riflebacteria bacterium]
QGARAFGQKELREALTGYTLAAAQEPECARAHLGMGRTLEVMGYADLARGSYQRAVVEEPALAEGWLSLALAEETLGRREEARLHLARGLDLLARGGELAAGWRREPAEKAHVEGLVRAVLQRLRRPGAEPELARTVARWAARELGLGE